MAVYSVHYSTAADDEDVLKLTSSHITLLFSRKLVFAVQCVDVDCLLSALHICINIKGITQTIPHIKTSRRTRSSTIHTSEPPAS